MSTHEPYKEMIAARALGALETGEARSLDNHLQECEECREELARLGDAAAALAYAVEPVEPPARVRENLLKSIRAEAGGTRDESGGSRSEEDVARKESYTSNVVQMARPQRSFMSKVRRYAAIAAAVIFAALVVATVLLWRENQSMKAEMARMNENSNRMQDELQREHDLIAAVTGPDSTFVRLAGTDFAPRARARLAYDQYTGRAVLFAYDLPPAPPGKAYQLWFIAEGRPPMPGKVFKTDDAGRAVMSDEMPANGRDAKIFAVTLEPEGGAQAPTSKPYLITPSS